jgi:hypothetical protein
MAQAPSRAQAKSSSRARACVPLIFVANPRRTHLTSRSSFQDCALSRTPSISPDPSPDDAWLLANQGREGNLMKWKEQLNADCLRRDARIHDCCDLLCPDLPKVLLADLAPCRRKLGNRFSTSPVLADGEDRTPR